MDAAFPRAHGASVCSARIRAAPEDFFVEEIASFEPSGSGEHLLLAVEKRGMNTAFAARRIAAWAGVAPGNNESAGKSKGAATRKGNVFLKSVLFAAASAAVRTKGSYYRDKYNRLRARRGPVRALMAIAHKLLVAAFHMLTTGEDFRDLGEGHLDRVARKRSVTKLVQRLINLGYDVMLVPKAA